MARGSLLNNNENARSINIAKRQNQLVKQMNNYQRNPKQSNKAINSLTKSEIRHGYRSTTINSTYM